MQDYNSWQFLCIIQDVEHTISWRSILRVIIACLVVYLVWRLTEVALIVFTAMMLASAFHPIVNKLKTKIPTTLAAVLVITLLLSPIIVIAFNIIPNLIDQFPAILATVSSILNKTSILPPAIRNIDLTQYTNNIGSYLIHSTSIITNFVTTFITVIFLTLYFLVDSDRLLRLVYDMVPQEYEQKAKNLISALGRVNGQYIRGNLIISVICGIVIFSGLTIMKVPFAGSLALFAAITDLLPLIGAFLGAAPAVIIAFSISPAIGFLTLALFVVYQQLENNLFAPNVYTRALDLSPALSFISVIIGGSLFGIFGAFIALPIAASIPTIITFVRTNNFKS